jgi:pSer/pThr/pTyr-binding forkhead associated (FHA) protein
MDHEIFEPTIKTSIDDLNGPVEDPCSIVEVSSEGETVWVLDRSIVIVGSDEAADVRIEDKSIAPYHAEIVHENGRYRIRHLDGPAPVCVNGEPTDESPLADGDSVAIGECTFTFLRKPTAVSPE